MVRLNFRRNTKYWALVAVLIVADAFASWYAFSRTLLPFFHEASIQPSQVLAVFALLQISWTALFFFNNRYRVDPTLSRFHEIQVLFKVTLGVAVTGVVYNELVGFPIALSSSAILQYWFAFAIFVSFGRFVIRHIQKIFLKRGYGMKNTLIVGVNDRAKSMAEQLNKRHLGYKVVGFVAPDSGSPNDRSDDGGLPVVSSVAQLKEAIAEYQISEVVLALQKPNHDRLLDIITVANGSPVSLKIIPDMYEVVSGLAKTEQISGLPLIQINPEILTSQQRFFKRLIDVVVALIVLVPLMPLWLIVAIAIKIDSPGPILYRQERSGLNGRRFRLNKFRSMQSGAESDTGPVWAEEGDPRITKVGKFLRRFRLDEVPQFINVLAGDMSVVGPRPERPFFVQQLMEEFPFYYRRHKIRPGITGWAQIKHSYDSDLQDVRQKLKYDFFYIENLSLTLDLMIMLSTVPVMLSGKGR